MENTRAKPSKPFRVALHNGMTKVCINEFHSLRERLGAEMCPTVALFR